MAELPTRVQDWLGRIVVATEETITVERECWLTFCIAVEDANPLYWDEAKALEHTGSTIAPPAMLAAWGVQHEWSPNAGAPALRPLELHFMLKNELGLKHGIVTGVEFEFHEPLHAGERVRVEQSLKSVGHERESRLGSGRDWVIDVSYFRSDGRLAGVQTLGFFAYRGRDAA